MLYTIDERFLHVWDLLEDEDRPIVTEEVGSAERRLAGVSLYSGSLRTRAPSLALAFDTGVVEVHSLHRRLYTPKSDDEEEQLDNLFGLMM